MKIGFNKTTARKTIRTRANHFMQAWPATLWVCSSAGPRKERRKAGPSKVGRVCSKMWARIRCTRRTWARVLVRGNSLHAGFTAPPLTIWTHTNVQRPLRKSHPTVATPSPQVGQEQSPTSPSRWSRLPIYQCPCPFRKAIFDANMAIASLCRGCKGQGLKLWRCDRKTLGTGPEASWPLSERTRDVKNGQRRPGPASPNIVAQKTKPHTPCTQTRMKPGRLIDGHTFSSKCDLNPLPNGHNNQPELLLHRGSTCIHSENILGSLVLRGVLRSISVLGCFGVEPWVLGNWSG